MECVLVYITSPVKTEAVSLARTLLKERLVACANIHERVTSLYWWEDQVQEADETVLIVKTRAELASAVIERVKSLHSYKTACVVALPVVAGNESFLRWIEDETAPRLLA